MSNLYITTAELKAYLSPSVALGSGEDTQILAAVTAACRSIDAYCGRRFYLDDTVSARYYEPECPDELEVDEFATTSGLVVAVDRYDNGSYSETWTLNTQFRVEPVNRERDGITGLPYDEIELLPGQRWPVAVYHPYSVKVTAQWGWAAVPDAVKQATFIKAARLYRRANTPEGFAAGEAFGAIRVSSREDPDVCMLVGPYVKAGSGPLAIA